MERGYFNTPSIDDNSSMHESQPRRRLEFETLDLVELNQSNQPLCTIGDNQNEKTCHPQKLVSKDLIPKIGMEFENESMAYKFYQNYAKAMGFGTRMSYVHRDKTSKTILDRVFYCSREGKRSEDSRSMTVKCPRVETRCNCIARIKISSRQDGKYRIVQFVANHNHELSTPSKTHLFRCYRNMSTAQEAEVDVVKSCGIPSKQIMEIMSKQAGGRENLGFIHDDLKNYLQSKRSITMKQCDIGGVLEYCKECNWRIQTFFCTIQVDEDDLITNIFWADAKTRTDFAHFGDVVCFDTTYRKHKDGRPIALFVGVNHHQQTLVFGAALLYDETVKTFEWLFDTFSRAMMDKMARTILTDQYGRMATALASQWPTTYHRLCIWHIYQNAAIHLSVIFAKFKDFASSFSKCAYDYKEVDNFFDAWYQMLEKYKLQGNKWVQKMFDMKEKWALVYGGDTFCADITTTQRSETMNSILKRYVNYKNDLLEFFNHFQRLLNDHRYEESKEDFRCSQSTPAMTFLVKILIHEASVYTHEVFELFNKELWKGIDCRIESESQSGSQKVYKIRPFHGYTKHTVTYNSTNDSISCSCKKIEFAGILCFHSLKIFTTLNVMMILDQYVQPQLVDAVLRHQSP